VHVTTIDMSLELLLGTQLEAIAVAGYRVLGASAPGRHVEALRRRGIEHIPLAHTTRTMAPLRDARALSELVTLFRRIRPTIVHTHNPKPGIYGRVAARLAGVPVIVNTVHGLYAAREDPRCRRAVVYGLERLAATCSHAELLQNPEDLATLRRLRVPPDRLTVMGNGIDLDRFDPGSVSTGDAVAARREMGGTGPADVVVGLVGRLVREKGYPEAFAAAARLRTQNPQVRMAVIGPDEPDKADALTGADQRLAEAGGVRFLGARADLVRLYAGMDMLVLASHREGFPRSPMEASAMGVPVIASNIRGCRQAVDDGVTGLLVPPRDPVALAQAIARLAADPAERQRMGAAARDKALECFDERHCVDLTLATYERLLARAGLAAPTQALAA
jgi:glycosyltransferase involved in cell wall biosynthesis